MKTTLTEARQPKNKRNEEFLSQFVISVSQMTRDSQLSQVISVGTHGDLRVLLLPITLAGEGGTVVKYYHSS